MQHTPVETHIETQEDPDIWFMQLWLHGRPEKTQEAYRADMERFRAYVKKPLPYVTLSDLQAFQDHLLELDLAATTRNRALAAIKSALSFGVRIGYLPTNVGLLVKLSRPENRLAERLMSEQSVARMLALETNPRNHAILVLLYRAGLSCAELCNLQWRNLQERDETGQITVFGKGDETRAVLLTQETWEEVMSLNVGRVLHLDDYVFQSRHKRSRGLKYTWRLDESMVFRIVQRADERAGIPGNVSPHWMRHAHAPHALENGAPITLVKETLGHKSIRRPRNIHTPGRTPVQGNT